MDQKERSKRDMHLLLGLSLLANVILACRLLFAPGSSQPDSALDAAGMALSKGSRHSPAAPGPGASRGGWSPSGTTDGATGLPDWRALESPDYREFVARLRKAGVPEDIIRDIIVADVRKTYAPQAKEILGVTRPHRFWHKPSQAQSTPTPDQIRRLNQLEQEEQSVITAVLGTPTSAQLLVDRLFVQMDSRNLALDFLPPDRRAAAELALEKAGIRHTEMNDPEFALEQAEDTDTRRMKLRLKTLEGVLTPAELADYQARLTPANSDIGNAVRFVDVSEEEYRRLLAAREAVSSKRATPGESPIPTETARAILGEERAAVFEKSSDWTYLFAREAAYRYSLPDDVADDVYALKRSAMAEADQLRRQAGLSAPERQRQAVELQRRTEAALRQRLGADGMKLVARDNAWLQQLVLPPQGTP